MLVSNKGNAKGYLLIPIDLVPSQFINLATLERSLHTQSFKLIICYCRKTESMAVFSRTGSC